MAEKTELSCVTNAQNNKRSVDLSRVKNKERRMQLYKKEKHEKNKEKRERKKKRKREEDELGEEVFCRILF